MLDPFKEVVLDVVGPLADLKHGALFAPRQLSAKAGRADRAHPAGARKKEAQGQEGEQRKYIALMKRGFAIEGIIFVAAKGGARVVIHVIANEADLLLELQSLDRLLQEQVARPIVAHHIEGGGAFRSAILHVTHVDVNPAPIEKESPVSSRLVPIAIMQIDQSVTVILEEPVPDPWQNILGLNGRLNQAAILGFQPCDALRHKL